MVKHCDIVILKPFGGREMACCQNSYRMQDVTVQFLCHDCGIKLSLLDSEKYLKFRL